VFENKLRSHPDPHVRIKIIENRNKLTITAQRRLLVIASYDNNPIVRKLAYENIIPLGILPISEIGSTFLQNMLVDTDRECFEIILKKHATREQYYSKINMSLDSQILHRLTPYFNSQDADLRIGALRLSILFSDKAILSYYLKMSNQQTLNDNEIATQYSNSLDGIIKSDFAQFFLQQSLKKFYGTYIQSAAFDGINAIIPLIEADIIRDQILPTIIQGLRHNRTFALFSVIRAANTILSLGESTINRNTLKEPLLSLYKDSGITVRIKLIRVLQHYFNEFEVRNQVAKELNSWNTELRKAAIIAFISYYSTPVQNKYFLNSGKGVEYKGYS